MKLLLTSCGISNGSIHNALVDMLGKSIDECRALFVPTAIYPFTGGPDMAMRAMQGKAKSPLCELGWKSLGVLELTALPSISKEVWAPVIEASDALLVFGGDPLYLAYWLSRSGLADHLRTLQREIVYVGVSAGSMAVAGTLALGETFPQPRKASGAPLTSESITFNTPEGPHHMTFMTAKGAGFVDFAFIPHAEHPDHPDASFANAERWAEKIPVPVYAIDDQTAIRVVGDEVDVISEGRWKRFPR